MDSKEQYMSYRTYCGYSSKSVISKPEYESSIWSGKGFTKILGGSMGGGGGGGQGGLKNTLNYILFFI